MCLCAGCCCVLAGSCRVRFPLLLVPRCACASFPLGCVVLCRFFCVLVFLSVPAVVLLCVFVTVWCASFLPNLHSSGRACQGLKNRLACHGAAHSVARWASSGQWLFVALLPSAHWAGSCEALEAGYFWPEFFVLGSSCRCCWGFETTQ